jgi:hypothetical protein
MLIQEIALEEIDPANELFRISEQLDCAPLLDSLRESGQLNPVILLERNSQKIIVCGFRRIHSIRKLGFSRALVRVLPENSMDLCGAFTLALRDNLSHRQLDPLEKSRALFSLQQNFGVPDEVLIRTYLPLLDLNPHESVLRCCLQIHKMHPGLRNCLRDGCLTHTSIETIAGTSYAVQDSISSLMERARLSASLQKKLLGLLEDLAASTGDPLSAPLNSPDISEIKNDPRLSPFQRGEKIYERLYRLRNPGISAALDRFHSQKELLRLPGSIRVTAHPFFEEPGVHVEFDAPDAERFRELASALHEAGQLPELKELFIVR